MIVVDTSALVAIMLAEPGFDRFVDILATTDAVMPATCLVELTMVMAGRRPGMPATDIEDLLEAMA